MTDHTAADTLATWRQRGDQRADPVRFRLMEALARRAQGLPDAPRRVVDTRLASLMAAYAQAADKAPATAAPPAQQPRRSPLAQLLDHIGRQAATSPADATGGLATPPELKTLQRFRATWSRLSTEQRLRQSLARVPDNPGPLNSEHLVHRALALMREQAPDYLHHFVAHADTLAWLDRAQARIAPAGAGKARGAAAKGGRRGG